MYSWTTTHSVRWRVLDFNGSFVQPIVAKRRWRDDMTWLMDCVILHCIYGLFFLILFTVCTAPLFNYSAIFIAASVQINALSSSRKGCEHPKCAVQMACLGFAFLWLQIRVQHAWTNGLGERGAWAGGQYEDTEKQMYTKSLLPSSQWPSSQVGHYANFVGMHAFVSESAVLILLILVIACVMTLVVCCFERLYGMSQFCSKIRFCDKALDYFVGHISVVLALRWTFSFTVLNFRVWESVVILTEIITAQFSAKDFAKLHGPLGHFSKFRGSLRQNHSSSAAHRGLPFGSKPSFVLFRNFSYWRPLLCQVKLATYKENYWYFYCVCLQLWRITIASRVHSFKHCSLIFFGDTVSLITVIS